MEINKILQELKEIKSSLGCIDNGLRDPFNFAGMRIIEEPAPPPKIKLSDAVTVSDSFRAEMNAWLLSRFGRVNSLLPKNQFLIARDYGVVIAPYGNLPLFLNVTA